MLMLWIAQLRIGLHPSGGPRGEGFSLDDGMDSKKLTMAKCCFWGAEGVMECCVSNYKLFNYGTKA